MLKLYDLQTMSQLQSALRVVGVMLVGKFIPLIFFWIFLKKNVNSKLKKLEKSRVYMLM